MEQRRMMRNGRTWTIAKLTRVEAAERDVDYWLQLTPEERVLTVADCLLGCLETQGIDQIPPLRRVHRRVLRVRCPR